jgi:hypothetical protein
LFANETKHGACAEQHAELEFVWLELIGQPWHGSIGARMEQLIFEVRAALMSIGAAGASSTASASSEGSTILLSIG